jgi:exopolyphosphatase/pppGpp-phosphohydrolase
MANVGQARPARIGVLDVGSNTVLLLVLEADGRVVRDAAHITRLGQGVFASGALAPEATLRTRTAIAEFAALARADGVERVVAVGTEALRRARDGAEFLGPRARRPGGRGAPAPATRRRRWRSRRHGSGSAPSARRWR